MIEHTNNRLLASIVFDKKYDYNEPRKWQRRPTNSLFLSFTLSK
jgi:hypothetical protein